MKKLFFSLPVLLVLLVFAFFIPNLLKSKMPIPADSLLGLYHPFRDQSYESFAPGKFPVKNPLITDPVLQTYPWRSLIIDHIKKLNLPFWNPYSFSGQPLLANVQSSPFSAFNILFLLPSFKLSWTLVIILPPILTALLMYFFLKEIGLPKESAFFAGLVLPFTGFFMVWMTWGTIITTAMWLPAILLLLEKASKKLSAINFLLLVFCAGQVVFSGHLQTALYVYLASLLYIAYKYFAHKKSSSLIFCTLAMVLGLLTSAVQLIPAIELVNLSARSIDQSFTSGREDWFIPMQNIIQLIAPDFFGNPSTYNYWGVWNYAEFVSYIGIIPLALAIFSLFSKSPSKNFFLVLLCLSLILAFENPISKIPYTNVLSPVSSLQPSRIIFLIVFSLSALSAYGLVHFQNSKPNLKMFISSLPVPATLLTIATVSYFIPSAFPQSADLDPRYVALRNLVLPLAFAAIFALLAIFKFTKPPKSLLFLTLIVITVTELFRFGYKFTPFSKQQLLFPPNQVTDYLQSAKKPFRIMSMDRRIMHPNISTAYKIESVDGYDPLYLENYSRYVSVMQSQNPNAEPGSFNRIVTPQKISRLANLLNVKYILSFDTLAQDGLSLVMQQGDTKVYENRNVLPRVFFVNQVIKEESIPAVYKNLLDPDLDLSKSAISADYSFDGEDSQSDVAVDYYSESQINITTDSEARKPLVLTNIYYPGWKAYVDGRQTPIFRANAIFQLIEVPEGIHKVEFKFRPSSFYNGLYVSVAAAFLSACTAFIIWRKKYQ